MAAVAVNCSAWEGPLRSGRASVRKFPARRKGLHGGLCVSVGESTYFYGLCKAACPGSARGSSGQSVSFLLRTESGFSLETSDVLIYSIILC